MTIEEKRAALERYCAEHTYCDECKCLYSDENGCFSGSDEHMLENYDRVFGDKNQSNNPYWERICGLSEKQRAKGLETYGKGLESNPAAMQKRIEHLQEELIDALMYCEWMKDKLTEMEGDAHDQN